MSSTHSTNGADAGGADTRRHAVTLAPRDLAFLERLDHDLRTPIGTMATVLDLLRSDLGTVPSHVEAVAVLERQVARLHSLTESLHDFSQRLGR